MGKTKNVNDYSFVEEWDYEKNSESPGSVGASSATHCFWLCKNCNFSWSMAPYRRKLGVNCPVCFGHLKDNITVTHASLMEEWDYEKNKGLDPRAYTFGSSVAVHWRCKKCKNSWKATINTRVRNHGCPNCYAERFQKPFSETISSERLSQWNYEKNRKSPCEYNYNSSEKIWWLCGDCGTEWQSTVVRSHKSICPNCKYIKKGKSISDVTPYLLEEWDYKKNILSPRYVAHGSVKKYHWKCSICGVSWEESPNQRHSYGKKNNGRLGCKICRAKIPYSKSAEALFPALKEAWAYDRNTAKLNEIPPFRKEKFWFFCKKHEEYNLCRLNDITRRLSVNGASKTVFGCKKCIKELLETPLPGKSFGEKHPELLKEWHGDNGDPNSYCYASERIVQWKCSHCATEWDAPIKEASNGRNRCVVCFPKYRSKGEVEVAEFVEALGFSIINSERSIISPLELDIFVPCKKIAIEYNGLYWHSEEKKGKNAHHEKWKKCKEAGIHLITIWEDDWIFKKEIVKNMLRHKLGVSDKIRIYARKCTASTISFQEAAEFLNNNHIQGKKAGTYYYALKHHGDIVAVSVWSKREDGVFELSRYASNAILIGGMSKLVKYFIKSVPRVNKIITFASNDSNIGESYEKIGFIKDCEIRPDYWYVRPGYLKREHKFGYRIARFKKDPALIYEEGLSEAELALLNGLNKVWDCGKTRFSLNLTSNQ